jgi:hypothetical protein
MESGLRRYRYQRPDSLDKWTYDLLPGDWFWRGDWGTHDWEIAFGSVRLDDKALFFFQVASELEPAPKPVESQPLDAPPESAPHEAQQPAAPAQTAEPTELQRPKPPPDPNEPPPDLRGFQSRLLWKATLEIWPAGIIPWEYGTEQASRLILEKVQGPVSQDTLHRFIKKLRPPPK